MKTKYVCRGLISLYVNFHNKVVNKFTCKNLQVGGEMKNSLLISREKRGPKKTQFFGINFQKVPKKLFICCFFKTLPAVQKFLLK